MLEANPAAAAVPPKVLVGLVTIPVARAKEALQDTLYDEILLELSIAAPGAHDCCGASANREVVGMNSVLTERLDDGGMRLL